MKRRSGIIVAIALAVMLSGCLQVHRPVVPDQILTTADHDWIVSRDAPIGDSDLAPKAVETRYRFDPEDDDSSFPAVLVLVGLRTVQRIDEQQLLETARDILEDEMENQGVQADTVTEQNGDRINQQGITTQWLSMTGTASDDALLFAEAKEIRVLAEAWFEESSNMHIVAIAIAQTVQSDFVGQERRDHASWNELVGDDQGTIDGATHSEGFIDHAITED